MTKLTNKQKRSVKRKVDIELDISPPLSTIYRNKKKYNRNKKHKKDEK